MGIYKLGYLKDLDNSSIIVNWDAGKAEYDKFGGVALDLDSTKMCRAIGKVNNVSGTSITCISIINYPNVAGTTFEQSIIDIEFENSEFKYGFIKLLSGSCRNNVYKITDNTTDTLTSSSNFGSEGVTTGDYFEVVSGSSTFEFPTNRNPNNQVFKRGVVNKARRFPFTQGGLTIFEGYQPDDFVMKAYLTTRNDIDRLELMLNHMLDYVGFDGSYAYDTVPGAADGFAPMILETGNHTIENQYLVYMNDYKIIRDSKYNDNFTEILIHFLNYSRVIYRGV